MYYFYFCELEQNRFTYYCHYYEYYNRQMQMHNILIIYTLRKQVEISIIRQGEIAFHEEYSNIGSSITSIGVQVGNLLS